MGEISEHVAFNPVSDKHHVAKECHETVTRGNHVDGTVDNSGHLSNRRVGHLDVNDKHLPAGKRRNNITPSVLNTSLFIIFCYVRFSLLCTKMGGV